MYTESTCISTQLPIAAAAPTGRRRLRVGRDGGVRTYRLSCGRSKPERRESRKRGLTFGKVAPHNRNSCSRNRGRRGEGEGHVGLGVLKGRR